MNEKKYNLSEIRERYLDFINQCRISDDEFSFTKNTEMSPFALCFAIFGINLLNERKLIEENKFKWARTIKENLDSLSTDLIQRREKLEVLIKESSEEKATLEKDRQSQVGNIDANVIVKYDTVYKARKGLCVVPVNGSACGGCGGFVPPQIVSEVRAEKGLHNCESCSRFLYYDS